MNPDTLPSAPVHYETPEEAAERNRLMPQIERRYNRLRKMEHNLVFERGVKDPMKNAQYRSLAASLVRDIAKARAKGWLPAAEETEK